MVIVAQLVRALVCGSRGRRFEPGLSPKEAPHFEGLSYFIKMPRPEIALHKM